MHRILLALCLISVLVSASRGADPPSTAPALPLGVSKVLYDVSVPAGVAPAAAKVALGEKLFKEKRLSSNDQVACETCQEPDKAFTDHRPLAEGVAAPKERTKRNATQFWDGCAP